MLTKNFGGQTKCIMDNLETAPVDKNCLFVINTTLLNYDLISMPSHRKAAGGRLLHYTAITISHQKYRSTEDFINTLGSH